MKLSKVNIYRFLTFRKGDYDHFLIEQRLFIILGFYSGILGLGAAAINILINARIELTIAVILFSITSMVVFYLSRFTKNILIGKWIFTFLILAVFTYFFFVNNGSRGPVLFLFMTFYLFLLFVWEGKPRLFFSILFFVDITIFFIIELKYPTLTEPYPDERSRVLDLYLSFYMFTFLIGSILTFVKNSYIKEKNRAEQSDRLKSAFLANMSHEIRTPMNAVLGFTQLLQEEVAEEKRELYLHIIKENSESLLRLIEDIIDISKIEAGELNIKKEIVLLGDLFVNIGSTFRKSIDEHPEKKIVFNEDYPEKHYRIIGDSTRLKQVLVNLVSNAFKYTDQGEIRIGYKRVEDHLRFYVKDTGTGIKKEHLQEIFQRFRKLETESSRKIQPGTGIGLSICKNLVELMGGTIGVNSIYEEGTEFFFTIPFIDATIPAMDTKEELHQQNWSEVDLSGMKILVAEDDEINFDFLRNVMEKKGAEVLHARDGKEAVELVDLHPDTDLILMDIMMPIMDGLRATEKVKQKYPHIPVIAQTALAMEGDEQSIRQAGCDDYLCKPIHINDLHNTIAVYFQKKQPADNP